MMNIPLKKLSLYSSGLGFFEHSGSFSSPVSLSLSFKNAAVNDALKSLTVNDPASPFPALRYALSSALEDSLKSFKIDLSAEPGLADILRSQRGAELEVMAPDVLRGRILSVEKRTALLPSGANAEEDWLSLVTPEGITSLAVKDAASFVFVDKDISGDLNRALDLLLSIKNRETREFLLSLPGNTERHVSVSYVIPMPVWKLSYRLELGDTALLQGWAIVDNDSDADWEDVELSLVTGKPVSFIQNLYSPYHTKRPEEPLAIAKFARAKLYESGARMAQEAAEEDNYYAAAGSFVADLPQRFASPAAASPDYLQKLPGESEDGDEDQLPSNYMDLINEAGAEEETRNLSEGVVDTAAAQDAGEHFTFTFKHPVSLGRRQSAMFPLLEAPLEAEKILVVSETDLAAGKSIHPACALALGNSSGTKLPAGPITIYDGTYAGDALLEFFPENERRIISYGEDLTVSASCRPSYKSVITTASIAGAELRVNIRHTAEKLYTIRNASPAAKKLVIEQRIEPGYTLLEPAACDEKTHTLYRFRLDLAAKEELQFTVREEKTHYETSALEELGLDHVYSYAVNGQIPLNVRQALGRAIELRRKANKFKAEVKAAEKEKERLISGQERIRLNLEAAGASSPQGRKYLERLADADSGIDKLDRKIAQAEKNADAAKKEYHGYLDSLLVKNG